MQPTAHEHRHRLFAVSWAICLLFDLSNRGLIDTPAQACATLGALSVLLWPRATILLVSTCAAYIANVVTHPGDFLFVHWYFDVLVCAVVVVGWLDRAWSLQSLSVPGGALLDALAPAARTLVLLAIGAAGLAKLNRAFLDPDQSCASALYLSQASAPVFRWVLPDATWARRIAIGLTLVAELWVPVAMLSRRTRPAAMAVATLFFFLLSINPINHLYEFACPMLALLILFTPDGALQAASARVEPHGRALRWLGRLAAVAWVAWLVGSGSGRGPWLARAQSCRVLVWLGLPALLAAYLGSLPPHRERLHLRTLLCGGAPAAWLLPLLMLANEASPYLGFPHQPTFTMASDLRSLHGLSNHLLLEPPPLPLNDTVEIVGSTDPFLRTVHREDARMSWLTLRWVLSRRPEARVRMRVGGGPVEIVPRVGDDPRLSQPLWFAGLDVLPWFSRSMVHTEQPMDRRCSHWHHPTVARRDPAPP